MTDPTSHQLVFTEKELTTIAAALQLALVRYGFLLQAVNAREDELLSQDEVRELRDRLRGLISGC